jgi:hypothetical protein
LTLISAQSSSVRFRCSSVCFASPIVAIRIAANCDGVKFQKIGSGPFSFSSSCLGDGSQDCLQLEHPTASAGSTFPQYPHQVTFIVTILTSPNLVQSSERRASIDDDVITVGLADN